MNRYIVCLWLLLPLFFFACQQEEEGMPRFEEGAGGLRLKAPTLDNETDIPVIVTKGAFGMNPDAFGIVIRRASDGTEVKRFPSYEEMLAAGMPLVLPQGSYTAQAYSYAPGDTKVSDIPYFAGETTFEIREKTVTSVSLHCTYQSVGVELRLSDRFAELLEKHPANYRYTVTVTNDVASHTFDAEHTAPVYFLDGCAYLTVKAAVRLDGTDYPERTYRLTNREAAPEPGEYYIVTLDAGTKTIQVESKKAGE